MQSHQAPQTAAMTLTDFNYDHPDRDVAAIKRAIANKLIYAIGKDPVTARTEDWLHAAALTVRDQLVERWMRTTRAQYQQDVKRIYYLSAEFLIGRTFTTRRYTHANATGAVVTSYYWHFVDVVWIALFATIYILR